MSDLGVRRPGLPLSSSERSTANVDNAETHTASTNSATNARTDHIETTNTGSHRAEPGTTTNVDRVAADLLQVKGSLSSPKVVIDPASAVGQVQNGNIEVRIPLNNGHRIGPAKVREDTFVKANLVIKNGKIDRENTRIIFENSNGERTDLDGPFIWDAEQIYIDSDGQLKADVPCFPDPNITKQVFGADADAVPDKIEDFVKLLDRQGQMLGKQELIQDYSMSNLSESTARTSPNHVGATDELGANTNRRTSDSAPVRNTSTRSEPKNGLTNAFRFAETQLQFSGTLKTGPMSFGDGLDLQIAPNTHVQGSGTLGDIDLTLDGHISSLEMKSKDSLLTTKDGSIKIAAQIHSARHADGRLDRSADKTIDCVISELKSNDIYFETPGINNKHRLKLDSFALNSSTHETPIARFTRDYAKSYPEMTLNLPDVSMKGLSADIEIKDADGKAANFLIGHGLHEENREGVDLRGSITYDSSTNDFTFDATTKDLDARLVGHASATDESVIELVGGEHFNLSLNEAIISGSGAISINSSAGTSELKLDADDDNPWTFKVDVEDAKFKGNPAETNLALDLSTDTHGVLRLDTLNLGKGRMPEFQGDAEFAVTLDALNFKTIDVPELNLKKGTQGTLTVHSMGWNEGDVSPTMDATLKLDLGADALLDIENIPGLEGARLNVDAETGNTCLLIDVQMQGDGTVHSQVDLNLKGLFLRTDFERGDAKVASLPQLDLPDTPIPNTGSMELLEVDTSTLTEGPQNLSETELLESYVPTNLPNFSIDPMEVFSVLDKAQVTLRLGLNRTRFNIAKADLTTEKGLFNDRIGVAYKLDLNVPDGNLTGKLHVVNGKIAPDVSVLRFSPPIKVSFDGDAYGPGPLEGDLDATVTVSSIKIRRDGNGRGYLEPQYDIDMTGALGIADL
ncbi:MAG: hypothetical protein QGI45_10310, partial [Myxococcota bacterium]|nr:hypothetical protein [Myxococcota bacterium]